MADLTLHGEVIPDYYGYSVGTAGDVNGDGFADVVVGAYQNDEKGANTGKAYVYSIPVPRVGVEEPPVAAGLRFLPPSPNPARGSASLVFELEQGASVTLDVFDTQGRLVDRPIRNEPFPKGVTTRVWRPERLGNGMYYLRARLGVRAEVRKLLWLGAR
jgi:hypothetical protein